MGTELSGSSPSLHFVSDPAGTGEEGIWVEALGPSPLSGRGDPGTLSRRQVTSCFLALRWLLGQDCGDASCFFASDPKGGNRGRSGVGRSHGDRRGRTAVRDKTKLVWGGRMRTGGVSSSCPLVRKPAPLNRAEPWSGALRSPRDRRLSF